MKQDVNSRIALTRLVLCVVKCVLTRVAGFGFKKKKKMKMKNRPLFFKGRLMVFFSTHCLDGDCSTYGSVCKNSVCIINSV